MSWSGLGALWLLLFAASWLALVAAGWRQRKEARAPWRRWLLSLLACALASTAPLALSSIVAAARGVPPEHARISTALVACLLAAGALGTAVTRPLNWHLRPSLREVDDPALVARVAELARAQGMAPPVVRQLPTSSHGPLALAWAGGLGAPTLVVTEGIVHRLTPGARDAVLGHELAHLANGSLWILSLSVPVALSIGTMAALAVPTDVAFALAAATWVGLRRILQRHLEIDCDLRAARVVGARETARALDRIHAVHPLGDSGLGGLLVHSTTTHPARMVRLSALARVARPGELDGMEAPPRRVRALRSGALAATSAWILALAAALVLSTQGASGAATWLLVVVACAPISILLGASMRKARRRRRLLAGARRRIRWWDVASVVALTLFVAVTMTSLRASAWMPSILVACVLLASAAILSLGVSVLRHHRTQSVAVGFRKAFAHGRVEEIVALASMRPNVVREAPHLRHDAAIALALTGRRDEALGELRDLVRLNPRYPIAALTLATILARHAPDEALVHADAAAALVPDEPSILGVRSLVLRGLGRSAEARDAAERALAIEPSDGHLLALRALALLDAGRLDEADATSLEAEHRGINSPLPLIARAEVLLARGDVRAADAARLAVAAARSAPLHFLDAHAVEILERAQSAARSGDGSARLESQ